MFSIRVIGVTALSCELLSFQAFLHAFSPFFDVLLHQIRDNDSVTEHIVIIKRFCCDLLAWMKRFASEAVTYWNTPTYKRVQNMSALPPAVEKPSSVASEQTPSSSSVTTAEG